MVRSDRRNPPADSDSTSDRAGHRGRRGRISRVSPPLERVSWPGNRPLRPMDTPSGENGFSLARSEDHLVWIFGSSRSGSTWLLRMLSELDDAVTIDDPHLGHHLGIWRPIPLAWATADRDPELTLLNDIKSEKPGYFFNERYRDTWEPALRDLIVARFDAQVRELVDRRTADPL